MNDLKKYHILVVDDDEAIRRFFEKAFSQKGYHVSVLATGNEAIDKMKENKYSLVFCDYKMPGLNGLETLKQMKVIHPKIPVILMSAFPLPREAYGSGVENILHKPISIVDLLKSTEYMINALKGHSSGINCIVCNVGIQKGQARYVMHDGTYCCDCRNKKVA